MKDNEQEIEIYVQQMAFREEMRQLLRNKGIQNISSFYPWQRDSIETALREVEAMYMIEEFDDEVNGKNCFNVFVESSFINSIGELLMSVEDYEAQKR